MSDVAHFLPARILRQVEADPDGRARFFDDVARYHAMDDGELLRVTEVCLKNLERLDRDEGADADLRHVLVPELWDRIAPGAGVRDRLRRISTTLAEHDPDEPGRPTFWRRALGDERWARLRADADRLRRQIGEVAATDAGALAERVRFAIAGSCVAQRWAPTQCVYEPGFTYRLVPAVARRCLARSAR